MMKDLTKIMLVLTFSFSMIHAGCGSCNVTNKKADKPMGDFVTKINDDGTVSGLVLTSCGMCNFGAKDSDCGLSIRVGENVFRVKGSGIEDQGDSHADDGFCNAIRVAEVKGKIKRGKFKSESFTLVTEK